MRIVPVTVFLICGLLLAATPRIAQDKGAEEKFNAKAKEVNADVGDALAKYGTDCLGKGMNFEARANLQMALEHDPENERAHKAMGHERKRVDNAYQWVPNPANEPPLTDNKNVVSEHRAEMRKQHDKVYRDVGQKLADLGQFAVRLELAAQARAVFNAALRYDPSNAEALKGVGWAREASGDWISPRETADREAARRALDDPPVAKDVDVVPEWTRGLAARDNPVTGIRAEKLTILGSVGLHREALRYAAAVRTLASSALGTAAGDLRIFLAKDAAQHEAYLSARMPGIPGLAKDNWIISDGEVEVLRDKDDEKVTMERVVLSVTMFEVRARCGTDPHPWFELGYASNLTRRLCDSIAQVPYAAKGQTPPDSGKWKKTLVTQIDAGTQIALEKVLVDRDPNETVLMYAYYFTRYLLQEHTSTVEVFCASVKSHDTMETALKTATQLEPARLEQSFLAWMRRGGK